MQWPAFGGHFSFVFSLTNFGDMEIENVKCIILVKLVYIDQFHVTSIATLLGVF